MFNASYFRGPLKHDVEASGGHPVMEILLLNGHSHRVRSIVDVTDDWVTLDAYLLKGDLAHHRPRFGDADSDPGATFRAVVSYDAIAAVVFDPSVSNARARPGFASG